MQLVYAPSGLIGLELTSHQIGKVLTGNRVFCFTYVHSRKSEQAYSNVLESNTWEAILPIRAAFISLVRGQEK